jgi:hypothetical protein
MLAVDEQLDAVPVAGREGARVRPAAGGRIEGPFMAQACEPAPVMRADCALDPVAEEVVDPANG